MTAGLAERCMDWLIGRRPLDRALPGVGALRAAPWSRLAAGEMKVTGLRLDAIPLFLAVTGALVAGLITRAPLPIAIGAAAGAALGLAVLLASRASTSAVALVLAAEGVRIHGVDGVVECPWTLFAAPGNPFAELFGIAVNLPIDPRALSSVVHRRDGAVVARGLAVRTRLFQVLSEREVRLIGGFRADPRALGALLLEVGRQIV